MTLSDVCINRPVFTWVLVAIPVVLGAFAYNQLGVDQFPNVDFPVCTVTTVLPGAGVEEMETSITKPIEDAINTVSGVDELRSTTQEGVSWSSPFSSNSRRMATSARRRFATRSRRFSPACPREPRRRSSTGSRPTRCR